MYVECSYYMVFLVTDSKRASKVLFEEKNALWSGAEKMLCSMKWHKWLKGCFLHCYAFFISSQVSAIISFFENSSPWLWTQHLQRKLNVILLVRLAKSCSETSLKVKDLILVITSLQYFWNVLILCFLNHQTPMYFTERGSGPHVYLNFFWSQSYHFLASIFLPFKPFLFLKWRTIRLPDMNGSIYSHCMDKHQVLQRSCKR